MNETIQLLARHGYILLIGVVLARQACLPIPAGLFFVAAGALSRLGTFSLSGTLGLSIMTFLVADLAWYAAGREFGDRILHFVCGLSRSPVSCVHKATDTFANNRVRMLLFSKFVVGLDAIAAPLAGAACLSPVKFLVLDALGALFWTMTYVGLGYVFSDQLDRVATHIGQTGTLVALAAAVGFCVYLLLKLARWLRFLRQFNLERITPEQLRDQLNAGEDVLLVDLQDSKDSTTGRVAIPGAVRFNPRRLEEYRDVQISPSQEVVLYCDCPGEFTSARVALALRRNGVEHVRPLAGGLRGWRERGFPVTSEIRIPPSPAIFR